MDRKHLRLYAVTDRAWTGKQTLLEQLEAALQGGVTMVQLREKELDQDAFTAEAMQVKTLCRKYGVPLLINDNVDVALRIGADGVHVGVEDTPVEEIRKRVPPGFLIGATAKTIPQAQAAQAAGADYLGVGALYPSPTKRGAIPVTREELRAICASVDIPAVAIGGIGPEQIPELKGCGIAGVAVVSALFGAADIQAAAQSLRHQVAEHIEPMKTALAIAGSDPSGGAGIQADLKTMTLHGVYAMSVLTALTAQNTTGVFGIHEVPPDFLGQQLDAVLEDIPPDAVKIGMISSAPLVEVIADRLRAYQSPNIVLDPVMVSTSGSRLMETGAVTALKRQLLPLVDLVTPNIPEAEVLSGRAVETPQDMETAARTISETYGCAVLCKGGHRVNDANDLLCTKEGVLRWFPGRRIDNPNTHGTGCTLSSAIAANLARGWDVSKAIQGAKNYLSQALADQLDLGRGRGPMNHAFAWKLSGGIP